jgi:Fur family transcriptional regulator, peroxide stress response regulator
VERTAAAIGRRVEHVVRRCREAGLNVTPQRLAIYRALLESEDHPSPEELYHRVRPSMPSLSLATVYKALDTLEALGVVEEVHVGGDTKRFDANPEHHHHLICTTCHRVLDFYDPSFDDIAPPRRLQNFVPRRVSVQVVGLCASCAKRSPK